MDDSGFFYGIGTGPGDADLLTIRASQIIRRCDVIIYVTHEEDASPALDTVKTLLSDSQQVIGVELGTQLGKDGEQGSENRLNDQKLDEALLAINYHLRKGADVGFLCYQDPARCIEFNQIKRNLETEFSCKLVPGVISD